MASIDWQTPLSTTFGLLSASVVYLVTALYWSATWVVLNVVASAPRYVVRAASVIATPLTYPLYYLWRAVAFLLSPIWALGRMIAGTGSLIIALIVKFKYLYIFFSIAGLVGIVSACLLFGTSNVLFSVLGISPSAQKKRRTSHTQLQPTGYSEHDTEPAPREEEDSDEAFSSSTDQEMLLSESGSSRHGGNTRMTNRLFEQAYRQAKSTRISPIKPSRRFRGLLAQTIHEESSESD